MPDDTLKAVSGDRAAAGEFLELTTGVVGGAHWPT
jgi:hypothetical protein